MKKKPVTVISAPKKKTKAEKIGRIVIFTIGPIILAIIMYLSGVFSFIGVRIYKEDRITGDLYVTVNEEEIFPSSASANFNDNTDITVTLDKNKSLKTANFSSDQSSHELLADLTGSSFAVHGGEEGFYTLDFTIEKEKLFELTGENSIKDMKDNLHIVFKYANKKWYYITQMKLSVVITSEKDGLYCELTADYFADNAKRLKIQDKVSKPVYLYDLSENNEIELVFGN